jgi:hemerythrin superfamily protein
MASSKKGSSTRARRNGGRARRDDAVALLKADHRQVEDWFAQFEKARSADRKALLAGRICNALRVHTMIEEEIFYPAFLEATGEEDLHHEAEIEHAGAKRLIAEIEDSGSGDEYFEARVKVLAEMIKHHVKEEEQPGGMFAHARASSLDLEELGARMAERKSELEGSDAARTSPNEARAASRAA